MPTIPTHTATLAELRAARVRTITLKAVVFELERQLKISIDTNLDREPGLLDPEEEVGVDNIDDLKQALATIGLIGIAVSEDLRLLIPG